MADIWRDRNPGVVQYTYWDARLRVINRKVNGWWIDYILVSKDIYDKVDYIKIRDDVFGSDHCPVEIKINFL